MRRSSAGLPLAASGALQTDCHKEGSTSCRYHPYMVSVVAPGTPVTIVRRSSPPEQWTATVVVAREESIAARVTDPPAAWQPDTDYMVIQGSQGARTFAICSFVAAKNDVAAFRLTTHWRPLDLRKDRRYPADLQVEVRSVLGTSRQPGRLVDISMGGLAVAVETRPGGSQLEVSLWNRGYSASVPCELVRATPAANGHTVLHLRFRELTPPQQAFVRQFIASLQAAQGEAS